MILKMKEMMTTVMSENLQRFELGLATKVGNETRSELARLISY